MSIVTEFERIRREHRQALRHRGARVTLGSSVVRVFTPGTKDKLFPILVEIPLEEMTRLKNQQEFRTWFEHWLEVLAEVIKRHNPHNRKIHPGYNWGHAAKILTLYLREMVLNSRYFSDEEVLGIAPLLYTPIDTIAIRRLTQLGHVPPFRAIREINTPEKFYGVQELLGEGAARVRVPRIWFDDNWGDRQ
jgi:hypothetical protein